MKNALREGILADARGPRAVGNRYPAKVPGFADEASASMLEMVGSVEKSK